MNDILLRGLIACACMAPTLLAYNQTPASTLYNQLLSLAMWGGVLFLARPAGAGGRFAGLPLAALGLMTAAGLHAAWQLGSMQEAGSLSLLLAAAAVLWLGNRADEEQRFAWGDALALGCVLMGVLGALIGCLQVFVPTWTDGQFIAHTAMVGRAVGNVRQPNHLATLLLMGAVGLIWLAQRRDMRWEPVLALMALLVAAVVLTASRTGLWFGVPLLFLWGLFDRQLAPRWRLLLLSTPFLALLAWWGMHWWSVLGGGVFGAETRLDREGAGSPSRIAILRNAWDLLLQNPWTGVGWGAFNRAWTLSEFPDRPIAFFDHTHNLPLQLLVELGWPLGGAVLLLLLAGFLMAARMAWRAQGGEAVARRAPLMLLLVVGLHSMLEYPLWYAYFLLPTVFAFGLALASGGAEQPAPKGRWTAWVGVLLIVGCFCALWEYRRVVAIYAPASKDQPLSERIARGQSTLFFSRHADYAAATALGHNAAALEAARRTGWQLIDARLLMAWARSLHAVGETDKALWVVQRLKEFRSAEGKNWLAECEEDGDAWFCQQPKKRYDWRDF